MKKSILIKLGGSLITEKEKPFIENRKVIRRLGQEIRTARGQKELFIVIGHGGGSYPHVPAKKFWTKEGLLRNDSRLGLVKVQDAAARLNRIVVSELLELKLPAISINPSSCFLTERGEVEEGVFLEPLFRAYGFGLLPVVYGDVVFDLVLGCTILSTEKILSRIARFLLERAFEVERIIYAGNTDGVYDRGGKTIQIIKQSDFSKLKKSLGCSDGIDVTGGMMHKVEECLRIARFGVPSQIINGSKANHLKKAILGQKVKGTVVRQSSPLKA